MTSAHRTRHNCVITRLQCAVASVRYDIDQPGYEKQAAAVLREVARTALAEAAALEEQ